MFSSGDHDIKTIQKGSFHSFFAEKDSYTELIQSVSGSVFELMQECKKSACRGSKDFVQRRYFVSIGK